MSIKLLPDSTPPYGGSYLLSQDETLELYAYVESQLAKGNIHRLTSPAAAPFFFVKVHGKKDLPLVEYWVLNDLTIGDSFPIPLLRQCLTQLFGCKKYAKIETKTTINLIQMCEGDECKPAFCTLRGLLEYIVMPFGLENVLACVQHFIWSNLSEFMSVFCFVYIAESFQKLFLTSVLKFAADFVLFYFYHFVFGRH